MIGFEAAQFSYGEAPVLRDITLTLETGSMHFLTGRSGAGKSTFLKLIYLALRPDSGVVKLFDRPVGQISHREIPALRRRMGVILQDCDLISHMSVAENIALPLRLAGERDVNADNIRELAAWVGVADRLSAFPPQLSSGERQRAAIARAVISSPELIIADEPTGNVDAESASHILKLFTGLNKLGKTVLIATHDLNLMRAAQGSKAHVLKLENGSISRSGAAL